MQTYLSHANIALASPTAISLPMLSPFEECEIPLCGFVEWQTGFGFALQRLDRSNPDGFIINHPMNNNRLILSMQPITGAPSAKNRIIDGGKIGQGVLDLLMVSALHHLKYKQQCDDERWIDGDIKWSDHVVMYHEIMSLSSKVLGLDYDNPYSEAFCRMLAAKGADFSEEIRNEVIRVISPILPNCGKLFIVVPEACTLNRWGESVLGDGNKEGAPQAELWSSLCMDDDSGWNTSEVAQLAALNVGDGLLDYGDFRHAIIRIR
jgi:hypothetical protein